MEVGLFSGVLLSGFPGEAVASPPLSGDWITLVFLVILVLLAWVRASHSRRFQQVWDCLVAPRFTRQTMREEWVFSHWTSIVLLIDFALVFGMLLYQVDVLWSWKMLGWEEGWHTYLGYAGLVAAGYLLKFFFLLLFRFLVGTDAGTHEYIFTMFLINKALGMILLPLVVLAAYIQGQAVDLLLWAGIAIFFLLFLYRLWRGGSIGVSYNVAPFYLFLYLCTLEILPLVVIAKVFVSNL